MSRAYSDIAFTPAVRALQTRMGSRRGYAPLDTTEDRRDALGDMEAEFIAARDGFYQATVSEDGWPYVQFRGGPAGFLKVLDAKTIAYADFRGNRQYISTGNLQGNDRISIILMDYANRARLKILGRVRLVEDDLALLAKLESPDYRARVERAVVIAVEAYDWNCPQHITPRFTQAEVESIIAPLRDELATLQRRAASLETAETPIGQGPLELVVRGVTDLTPRVRAFVLARPDGKRLPDVAAGAHVTMPVPATDLARAAGMTRSYTIARVLEDGRAWEIAVQREDGGQGGSRAIHGHYRLGLRVRVPMPGNNLSLHDDSRPAVLIAGGIGVTPMRSMAEALASAKRPFALHYAVRSAREAPYRHDLERLAGPALSMASGEANQRLDIAAIVAGAPANAVFYVCGPGRLVDAVLHEASKRGFSSDRVRVERFASTPSDEDRPLTVKLARSGLTLRVTAQESVLDAIEKAGIDAPSSCRNGQCGSCAVKVLAGQPEHRDVALKDRERDQAGLMCICVSRARTYALTLDL
ncbi:MAG: 2Fe-2S iron-sulfur cluster binding domain-containing protein [Betaproteobacteria bacterium]|nr:2Fe-2S iron-sulfur cluster binding domain-containing protein [Betaproteobacteria bacterium]